ncbi:MAG: hypothetical protein AB7K09_21995 [Planctomycetota bacterium]
MHHADDHAPLIADLQPLLSDAFGGPVRCGEPTVLTLPGRRHTVMRVPLLEPRPDAAPPSVIVKQIAPQHYSENSDPEAALKLAMLNEIIGLTFLHDRVGFRDSPGCHAGNSAAGFCAIEDLGDIRCIDHTLLHGTADEAATQLTGYARCLGRMHAMAAGQYDAFHALRREHGSTIAPLSADDLAGRLGETVGRAQDLVATVDVPLGEGTLDEMRAAMRIVADPGPFRTYTHSDACVENACVAPDGTIKLLDFEYGSYGHALLDGCYARLMFPTCWCVRTLPDEVVAAIDAAYREELRAGIPAAADDAVYARELTLACAFWVITAWVFARDRGILFQDIHHGLSTVRQRIVARSLAFVRFSQATGELPAFAGLCQRMADGMQELWPDLPGMDTYPAFGGAPGDDDEEESEQEPVPGEPGV